MKKWMIFAVASCLCISVAACAGTGGFSDETIRYKITVTVDTPEGVKTGSAVREAVRHTESSVLPEQGGTFYSVSKGEAVVIDLGTRGILFSLIDEDREAKKAFSMWQEKKPSSILTIAEYPRFVTFQDLSNPNTVTNVLDLSWDSKNATQYLKEDDTETIFGSGVKIQTVVISVTDAPISWGIEAWLPWLPARKNMPGLIGSTPDKPVFKGNLGLNGIEFSRGRFW